MCFNTQVVYYLGMQENMPPKFVKEHPLDTASRLLGGRGVLAQKLDLSSAAITNWKSRGVPVEHCALIEQATSGVVTRQQLRPTDWHRIWPELAGSMASQEGQGVGNA